MDAARYKRQKVMVACDPCRNRKVKCDGCEPVCAPCRKKSSNSALCTWSGGAGRTDIPTDKVKWLDERIRQLEHRNEIQAGENQIEHTEFDRSILEVAGVRQSPRAGSIASIQPSAASPPCQDMACESTARVKPYFASINPTSSTMSNANIQPQEPLPSVDSVPPSNDQSVHAIIGATVEEQYKEGFFGSSSAGRFMQSVKMMVEQRQTGANPTRQPLARWAHNDQPLLFPRSEVDGKHVDYSLPLRKKADCLMAVYWKYVHTLYPFLDAVQTQEEYERLWRGDSSVSEERSFLCLLNAIFALSSQLSPSDAPEERERMAATFYLRARQQLDLLGTGSVRSVQSLLLLGMYCQSTNNPHHCWMFMGYGIRTAQSLGLHLRETSERAPNIRTRETLRRVWHGCVMMDRILAMTYGRPCGIGPRMAAAVPLPVSMNEEQLLPGAARQGGSHEDDPHVIEFFIHSLRLYEILQDILYNLNSPDVQQAQSIDDLYETYFGNSFSDQRQLSILGFERKLTRWEESIPEHLKIGKPRSYDGQEAIFHRQAVVLHQRHLYIRLLLLRPVLSSFITSEYRDMETPTSLLRVLPRRIFLQCAVVCVKVAQDAIETVYNRRATNTGEIGYLSAWWYNVLFLYTSATVLIAARLSPSILAELSEASILDSSLKTVEALEGYGNFGTSIRRLITTLRLLFDMVPQQYSRQRKHPPQPETSIILPDQTRTCDASDPPPPLSPNRCSPNPMGGHPAAPVHEPQAVRQHQMQENKNPAGSEIFWGFDDAFDPNDVSWLTTVPSDSLSYPLSQNESVFL
ncbi:fungal-specific transcription factor domain-containing protein [Talaromyces proteolyticus]|uniref:Fungal-specific transcription factor domain-containing protein n=1 Tax=Talaromyces proteolyticus TaxID=1131652 RepID=A0AAD4PX77_9EURO|nr:fungal-specific transcription factor domain-containing protein [Talaromyces proteolyticus]KAH8699027.1 fungal-specific transcription factor domain-containing protein [Talaromyces proteolyticus]